MITWDYITMSCCPAEEEWPSDKDSTPDQRQEVLRRYKKMLQDKFPIPKELEEYVKIKIKTFDHDFGPYSEVCVTFKSATTHEERESNPLLQKAVAFAYMCDDCLPGHWTDTEQVDFEDYHRAKMNEAAAGD